MAEESKDFRCGDFCVGRNLWFWAPNVPKYSNYDPTSNSYGETNVQGIDYTSAPSTRRIAFNLKLTF